MLEEEGNKQATKMDGCQKIGGKLIGPGKEIFRAGGKIDASLNTGVVDQYVQLGIVFADPGKQIFPLRGLCDVADPDIQRWNGGLGGF